MMLPTDKQQRKERPVASGVLSYFPDALAEVAHVSYVGNQQHNPGEAMHWARHKSTDHADCVARHLMERGTIDDDGMRHTAKMAWRALALLQVELEGDKAPAPNRFVSVDAIDPNRVSVSDSSRDLGSPYPPKPDPHIDLRDVVALKLVEMGCPPAVAKQIVGGITFSNTWNAKWAYVAGPMRGHKDFNFPAFDAARDALTAKGYNVISPADIDRNAGDGWKEGQTQGDVTPFVLRDFWALLFLRKFGPDNAIAMLRGWTHSTGAYAEYHLARWLQLSEVKDV